LNVSHIFSVTTNQQRLKFAATQEAHKEKEKAKWFWLRLGHLVEY
jgi:hypothetical protein